MSAKEAKARIKINKLLEAAEWRFFDSDDGPANIHKSRPMSKLLRSSLRILGKTLKKSGMGLLTFYF